MRPALPLRAGALFFLLALPSPALAEWVFQFSAGSAWNIPTPLKITQEGEPDLELTARYDTRPFRTHAPYFDIRIGRWKNRSSWEVELHHHKLFLSNRPDEVQQFQVSHGYSLLTLNRAWLIRDLVILRLGAGAVITHPESEVRGREYHEGYHLSGAGFQLGLEKRFPLGSGGLFFALEGKFTAAYAVVPIAGGEATVPNLALHGLFGLGYGF